jgi:hypothetical protein
MSAATETVKKVAYKVKADSVEACNCPHGCNCQFVGIPNEGKCEFIIGYAVKQGRYGDVSLNGVRAVVAAKYPKAIHVHIVYPKGGFFWNDAVIATTKTMRAEHGDFRLEWPNKYASAAEVNWTNEL